MSWMSLLPRGLRLRLDQAGLHVRSLRDALQLAERPVMREGRPLELARGQGASYRRLELLARREETANAVTLVFANSRPDPVRFRPGQYLVLIFRIDGQEVRRPYSFSSDPAAERLEVTVKRVPGGLVSNHIHDRLEAGAEVRCYGPCGSFGVAPQAGSQRELVLIGGGSGVTPLMSMIRAFCRAEPDTRLTFLDGNRDRANIIFAEALRALEAEHPQLTVHHVLERPHEGFRGTVGRLDAPVLDALLPRRGPYTSYFVCGPQPMMDGVEAFLTSRGVTTSRIHLERFYRSPPQARVSAGNHTVELRRSGRSVQVAPGQTVLEAGLAAGLDLPYSCSVGGCATCKARLLTGELVMAEPNSLSREERERGFRLLCIARPTCDAVIDL